MKSFLCFLLVTAAACHPSPQIGELVGVPDDAPLVGTDWQLLGPDGQAMNPPAMFRLEAKDSSVAAFAGCNQISGKYKLSKGKLSMTLASTQMACEGKMETEAALNKVLSSLDSYSLKKGILTLKKDGTVIGTCRRYSRKSV